MALQDILAKIKEEIEKKAKELEKKHEEELAELKKRFAEQAKNQEEQMKEKVDAHYERILDKTGILAEMEGKNTLLKAKRELIDALFQEAIAALSKSSHYEEILTGLLKKADLDGAETEVIPAKGKEDATKKALSVSGKTFKLSDKSADIEGGFILEGKSVEIDNSFKTIIQTQLRDNIEIEVAKLLF